MLLEATGIKKAYGIQELFAIDKMQIEEGDRIGLVGVNGAGKSTLLKILMGSAQSDEGHIRRFCEIGWIDQMRNVAGETDGDMISRLQLKGSAVKSGGEKTRLAIATAMSGNGKLLFADEPTTNLDMQGVEILEKMLKGYKGAFVLISHDRAFLSKMCNCIWDLEDGKLRTFPGSYEQWVAQKKREKEFAQFEYEHYQNEKKRLQKTIVQVQSDAAGMLKPPVRMGRSEWMLYKGIATEQQKNVQSRSVAMEKRLSRMEVKEKPKEEEKLTMRLGVNCPLGGRNAISVEKLTVCYGQHVILNQVSMTVPANKRTVIMGNNGAGKTTLLRKIMEEVEGVRFLPKTKIGYFSQEHEILQEEKTAIENVQESSVLPEHLVRIIMANLYLTKAHIYKKVSVLSGGERAKVMLAKLLASDINVLILDEPTNHIDMYTAEALEELLKQWEGTLLMVTHDRKLAEQVAHRIIFVEDGKAKTFEGTLEEYKNNRLAAKKAPKEQDWELQKSLLIMRMAELEAKIRRPKKGVKTQQLQKELHMCQEEYQSLLGKQKI